MDFDPVVHGRISDADALLCEGIFPLCEDDCAGADGASVRRAAQSSQHQSSQAVQGFSQQEGPTEADLSDTIGGPADGRFGFVCLSCHPPALLGPHQIAGHVLSAAHAAHRRRYATGADDFECCRVTINGRAMLLDSFVVYPAAMFGAGAMLYDDAWGAIIALDCCGGVRVLPGRSYTVVRLALPIPRPLAAPQRPGQRAFYAIAAEAKLEAAAERETGDALPAAPAARLVRRYFRRSGCHGTHGECIPAGSVAELIAVRDRKRRLEESRVLVHKLARHNRRKKEREAKAKRASR